MMLDPDAGKSGNVFWIESPKSITDFASGRSGMTCGENSRILINPQHINFIYAYKNLDTVSVYMDNGFVIECPVSEIQNYIELGYIDFCYWGNSLNE